MACNFQIGHELFEYHEQGLTAEVSGMSLKSYFSETDSKKSVLDQDFLDKCLALQIGHASFCLHHMPSALISNIRKLDWLCCSYRRQTWRLTASV